MHRGTPFADDVELREEGVVRIYDIFFDYEVLLSTDAYIREVSAGPDFQRPHEHGGVPLTSWAATSSSAKRRWDLAEIGARRRAPVRRADLHVVPRGTRPSG